MDFWFRYEQVRTYHVVGAHATRGAGIDDGIGSTTRVANEMEV